ncbi:MAG: hypothetical protein Q9184_003524 [Pyrenodesmia sp. 2 TL-2023]
MSAYYYGPQHHHPSSMSSHSSHTHHGSRSRRAPRLSASQNTHRQFRGVRSMKGLTESPPVSAFRARFEAGRSFDLDDDLEFCPGLLTEDDSNNNQHQLKLHQPAALRTRNAIPIVNPSTGMRVPSPPSSISPAMMQQQTFYEKKIPDILTQGVFGL